MQTDDTYCFFIQRSDNVNSIVQDTPIKLVSYSIFSSWLCCNVSTGGTSSSKIIFFLYFN